MGGTRFGAGGPRSLDGARGVWMLDGWHAAQELAQELGGLAQEVAGGGPRTLDG